MLMKPYNQDDSKNPDALGAKRRMANGIKGWSHYAIVTHDMEATRHFWEDLLGMPLVASLVGDEDWTHNKKSNFVHCFFELGDGSGVAFFQFAEGAREEKFQITRDAYELHLALGVDGKDRLMEYKKRLEASGVELVNEIDHGICHSIYMHDPNGMSVELTTALPGSYEAMEEQAKIAHSTLKTWLREDSERTARSTATA
jgi:catechol 2,3-dioxygenase-like lactoylglutathione lyase family enzyme